jgi:hypothetical protein
MCYIQQHLSTILHLFHPLLVTHIYCVKQTGFISCDFTEYLGSILDTPVNPCTACTGELEQLGSNAGNLIARKQRSKQMIADPW